ncbi:hypothetical protein [Sphingomonas sp. Ant20]|jgi:hypothetical protein|uniref:hypothetical protein n=1 Tax=Sphingomonas sp. Ant20 TaxID=104605 RepID=UPI000538BCAF|nr:hypothetical protein [Sphingomonas sp. Ant20]KHA65171.1 hypothetical protein NI18_03580 [Sphingomonas sp. Ant20]
MEKIDMDGVDPLRWAEVRRRADVIRKYLAVEDADEVHRKEHARLLGLSPNQFMALVRAWREHEGRAARLAGSGAKRGAPRRRTRLAVPHESKTVAAAIIDELGGSAPFVDINRRVAEKCLAQGLTPPSRSTVWNMVMSRRSTQAGPLKGVVVGTCRVRLPVQAGTVIAMPSLTLAVRSEDGAVLAASMSEPNDGWSDFLFRLVAAEEDVRIDETLSPLLPDDGHRSRSITPTAARSALSRVLGRGIERLRLVYVASKAIAPERLLTTREDRPLSPGDAHVIVADALTRHNGARQIPPPIWIDTGSQ